MVCASWTSSYSLHEPLPGGRTKPSPKGVCVSSESEVVCNTASGREESTPPRAARAAIDALGEYLLRDPGDADAGAVERSEEEPKGVTKGVECKVESESLLQLVLVLPMTEM